MMMPASAVATATVTIFLAAPTIAQKISTKPTIKSDLPTFSPNIVFFAGSCTIIIKNSTQIELNAAEIALSFRINRVKRSTKIGIM